MEAVNVPISPTQAVKPKNVLKSKSKTPSVVSQKTTVLKTTISQPEESEHVSKIGEGTGDNNITQKNKVGKGDSNQSSHLVSS